jgi:hypothetical protein
MKLYLFTLAAVLCGLAYTLDAAFFLLLYGPMDPLSAEAMLTGGSLAKGGLSLLFGLLGGLSGLGLRKFNNTQTPLIPGIDKMLILHGIFMIAAAAKYLLLSGDPALHIVSLIVAAFSFFMMFQPVRWIYGSDISAWRHPTTTGLALNSGFIITSGILILSHIFIRYESSMLTWLGIFLISEIPMIFGRFRFLSRFDSRTRMVAAKLLNENIFLFGGYIIAGIFIPLVFIGYNLWIQPVSETGTALLAILGALVERYLFFTVNASEISEI